jgi:ABC-2 type transport system ATP-binding protein
MIKVENLVKTFGAKRAVDDVSFSVERGEVLGFLGPNGAGKSTTMRIITGFYPPTSGRVTVGGFDIVEDPLPAKRLSRVCRRPAGHDRRRQEKGDFSRCGNLHA